MAEIPIMSEPPEAAAMSDGSLIAVIESLRAEPEAADSVPTFGPIDERGQGTEEGWLPTLTTPQSTTEHVQPMVRRSRARLAWIVGGGIAIGLIGGVLAMTLGGQNHPATVAPAAAAETMAPSAAPAVSAAAVPAPATQPPAAAAPEIAPQAAAAADVEPTVGEPVLEPSAAGQTQRVGTPPATTPRGRRRTVAKVAGSNAASNATPASAGSAAVTPATPAGSGSPGSASAAATEPAPKPATTHVEWNPDMLMPSDSPHGSSAGSAKPPSK
jgi:hypothetical protein